MDSHSLPSWVAKILIRLKNWWSISGVDWSPCRDMLVALAKFLADSIHPCIYSSIYLFIHIYPSILGILISLLLYMIAQGHI